MNTFRNMLLGHRWKRLFVKDGKNKYRLIHNYFCFALLKKNHKNYGGKQKAENRVKRGLSWILDLQFIK